MRDLTSSHRFNKVAQRLNLITYVENFMYSSHSITPRISCWPRVWAGVKWPRFSGRWCVRRPRLVGTVDQQDPPPLKRNQSWWRLWSLQNRMSSLPTVWPMGKCFVCSELSHRTSILVAWWNHFFDIRETTTRGGWWGWPRASRKKW